MQNRAFDVRGCCHIQEQECAYPSGISVVGSYPQRPSEADCSVCHFSWLYMIRMLKHLLASMRKNCERCVHR
jgi:hypothetical protein